MIPDEGKQLVVGDVKGGEIGRISFLFGLFLGTLLALALASLQLEPILCSCRSASLSLPFARQLEYYPPEWSICLPADIALPWLRADQGTGTGRKE